MVGCRFSWYAELAAWEWYEAVFEEEAVSAAVPLSYVGMKFSCHP